MSNRFSPSLFSPVTTPRLAAAALAAASLLAGATGRADVDAPFGSPEGVVVLPSASCASMPPGSVNVTPGPGTHSPGSLFIAAANDSATPVVPVFVRDASPKALKSAITEPGWTVDLTANLGRGAHPGNLLVVVFDADDAHAVHNGQATALHQTMLPHAGCAALRLALTPDEGARPNHLYRIQLVQLLPHKNHEKRVILGESVISLQ